MQGKGLDLNHPLSPFLKLFHRLPRPNPAQATVIRPSCLMIRASGGANLNHTAVCCNDRHTAAARKFLGQWAPRGRGAQGRCQRGSSSRCGFFGGNWNRVRAPADESAIFAGLPSGSSAGGGLRQNSPFGTSSASGESGQQGVGAPIQPCMGLDHPGGGWLQAFSLVSLPVVPVHAGQ